MKKSLLFRLIALVVAMMCALGANAAEAYLNYTPSNTTLTFYYDNLRETRTGPTYDIDDYNMFAPAWCNDGTNENVTRVVFDPSFANVRPVYTACWFMGMQNLQSITGMNYLNTSEVKYMQEMFYGCGSLTSLDPSHFNTDNVTDMSFMFADCSGLTNLNLSNFNTGKVEYMSGLFAGCSRLTNLDLSNFNTARVENMREMFCSCINLTSLDVSSFITGSVTDMSAMFCDCINLTNLNLENFVTVYVEDMTDMFNNCKKLTTITVGNGWSTESVYDSDDMFTGCIKLVGGSGTTYDANHTDAEYAHIDGGPSNPGYLTGGREAYLVYTPSNTTMTFYYDKLKSSRPGTTYYIDEYIFVGRPAWIEDGTSANVTRVVFDPSFADARPYITMEWFGEMRNLQSITGMNYLNTSSVLNMMGMFRRCSSLTSLDLSGFNTASTVTMTSMFAGCSGLTSLDLTSFNTENVNEMRLMFSGCSGLTSLNVSSFNTTKAESFQGMFEGCTGLTSLDLTSFNTENVEAMYDMFYGCENLTTIYVGSEWDASYVDDSDDMFKYCENLVGGAGTTYDPNHIDASYAHIDGGPSNPGYLTDVNDLKPYAALSNDCRTLTFYHDGKRGMHTNYTYSLNEPDQPVDWSTYHNTIYTVVFDPSFADVRPVTMRDWFDSMSNLTSIIGLEYLNTSEVTDMYDLFNGCSSLTSVDLEHFDTHNVTCMSFMFRNCSSLGQIDMTGFDTRKVTDMRSMFNGCTSLESLDLSSFDTHNVTNMLWMFRNCSNLATIYAGTSWDVQNVTSSGQMFTGCTSLVGGKGTTYDASHVDKTYAHIDGGTSNPGYFSLLEPEAYACYMYSTLTFYYDKLRNKRQGATYDMNTGSNDASWDTAGINVYANRVVFDQSFADYRPTTTYDWFYNMSNLHTIEGIEYLNTSEVTNMAFMFEGCSKLTSLDLSGFKTNKVTNMTAMFRNCTKLQTIYVGNGWSTNAVTQSINMFWGCTSLVGGQGTTYSSSHDNAAYAHIDGGPSNPGYFTGNSTALRGDVDGNGSVGISDVSALIDYLLSGDPNGVNVANADCDQNNSVGIGDVSALIDYLLSGSWN